MDMARQLFKLLQFWSDAWPAIGGLMGAWLDGWHDYVLSKTMCTYLDAPDYNFHDLRRDHVILPNIMHGHVRPLSALFENLLSDAGFVDSKQNFQRRTFAFCVDGLTSVIASVMGTSPITAFVESASGIRAGGRTGLTALTVSLYFAATLFFNPLICKSAFQLSD